jgi:hypothetical protein
MSRGFLRWREMCALSRERERGDAALLLREEELSSAFGARQDQLKAEFLEIHQMQITHVAELEVQHAQAEASLREQLTLAQEQLAFESKHLLHRCQTLESYRDDLSRDLITATSAAEEALTHADASQSESQRLALKVKQLESQLADSSELKQELALTRSQLEIERSEAAKLKELSTQALQQVGQLKARLQAGARAGPSASAAAKLRDAEERARSNEAKVQKLQGQLRELKRTAGLNARARAFEARQVSSLAASARSFRGMVGLDETSDLGTLEETLRDARSTLMAAALPHDHPEHVPLHGPVFTMLAHLVVRAEELLAHSNAATPPITPLQRPMPLKPAPSSRVPRPPLASNHRTLTRQASHRLEVMGVTALDPHMPRSSSMPRRRPDSTPAEGRVSSSALSMSSPASSPGAHPRPPSATGSIHAELRDADRFLDEATATLSSLVDRATRPGGPLAEGIPGCPDLSAGLARAAHNDTPASETYSAAYSEPSDVMDGLALFSSERGVDAERVSKLISVASRPSMLPGDARSGASSSLLGMLSSRGSHKAATDSDMEDLAAKWADAFQDSVADAVYEASAGKRDSKHS